MFWDPGLVSNFRPAARHFADEPPGLSACFKQQNETVNSFIARTPSSLPEVEIIHEMQHFLLAHIRNDGKFIGIYNDFYIRAMYLKGYADPETKRLAYMYAVSLSLLFSSTP